MVTLTRMESVALLCLAVADVKKLLGGLSPANKVRASKALRPALGHLVAGIVIDHAGGIASVNLIRDDEVVDAALVDALEKLAAAAMSEETK